MEASNLPDTEFKAMDTKMLKELSENFNRKKGHRHHKKRISQK